MVRARCSASHYSHACQGSVVRQGEAAVLRVIDQSGVLSKKEFVGERRECRNPCPGAL